MSQYKTYTIIKTSGILAGDQFQNLWLMASRYRAFVTLSCFDGKVTKKILEFESLRNEWSGNCRIFVPYKVVKKMAQQIVEVAEMQKHMYSSVLFL